MSERATSRSSAANALRTAPETDSGAVTHRRTKPAERIPALAWYGRKIVGKTSSSRAVRLESRTTPITLSHGDGDSASPIFRRRDPPDDLPKIRLAMLSLITTTRVS